MNREQRSKVLDETKAFIDEYAGYVGEDIIGDCDCYFDDNEVIMKMKTLRVLKMLAYYAEFQAKQIDAIEDMNKSILNEVRRLQNKEAK